MRIRTTISPTDQTSRLTAAGSSPIKFHWLPRLHLAISDYIEKMIKENPANHLLDFSAQEGFKAGFRHLQHDTTDMIFVPVEIIDTKAVYHRLLAACEIVRGQNSRTSRPLLLVLDEAGRCIVLVEQKIGTLPGDFHDDASYERLAEYTYRFTDNDNGRPLRFSSKEIMRLSGLDPATSEAVKYLPLI